MFESNRKTIIEFLQNLDESTFSFEALGNYLGAKPKGKSSKKNIIEELKKLDESTFSFEALDDLMGNTAKLGIKNVGQQDVWVAVTTAGGHGDPSYFYCPPGHKEIWHRHNFRYVTININLDGCLDAVSSTTHCMLVPIESNQYEVNGKKIEYIGLEA